MQRRIDLALMLDHELRTMQQRFEMLRRTAHEIGANEKVLAQWQQQLDEIKYELGVRATGGDADLPF